MKIDPNDPLVDQFGRLWFVSRGLAGSHVYLMPGPDNDEKGPWPRITWGSDHSDDGRLQFHYARREGEQFHGVRLEPTVSRG